MVMQLITTITEGTTISTLIIYLYTHLCAKAGGFCNWEKEGVIKVWPVSLEGLFSLLLSHAAGKS